MPKPKKNETKKEFVNRSVDIFLKEGYPIKEALGRAYGFWDTYKTNKNKKWRKKKKSI